MASTRDVLNHHLKCLGEGDLDTFVVPGGKIVAQSFAGKVTPRR